MAEYHDAGDRAGEAVAERGIRVFPEPPHTNAFRIHVPGPPPSSTSGSWLMETERLALTPPLTDADVPGWSWTELTVGAVTMEWDPEEAADRLAQHAAGLNVARPAPRGPTGCWSLGEIGRFCVDVWRTVHMSKRCGESLA